MKRITISILIILLLLSAMMTTSCDRKDPTGPAIFLGAVIILGITVGGWFDDDYDESTFPPEKYDVMSRYNQECKLDGSIVSDWDYDWYRTEMMHPGERITIWSESWIGVRAVMVDEYGRYYPTDNYGPGSNFKLEIKANEYTSYWLMVYGHEPLEKGSYEIHWRYRH